MQAYYLIQFVTGVVVLLFVSAFHKYVWETKSSVVFQPRYYQDICQSFASIPEDKGIVTADQFM